MTTAVQIPETTAATTITAATTTIARICLPEIPERHFDDMTSFDSLHRIGLAPSIIHYLGNPDTTIVSAEHYIVPGETYKPGESRAPDLVVAFDADPVAHEASNGYRLSDQGKPPDFILEVASRTSRQTDRTGKKGYYENLGVQEYWLFDRTGQFYGFHLAGFRLVQGQYEEIQITKTDDGAELGFSRVLNLFLRWRDRELELLDPDGNPIPTFASEHIRANTEAARANQEAARADSADVRAAAETSRADQEAARADSADVRAAAETSRADQEAARADAALARIQELEAELRRRQEE